MTSSNPMKDKMWRAMADSPFLMVSLMDSDDHSLPMTAQLDADANGEFWFYTTVDNRIASGGTAMAQYVSKGHDLFACITGTLKHETDPAIIDKYWSNPVEAWYEEGRNDPALKMMRFELFDAEIWEASLDIKGKFKLATGRTIDPDETGDHTQVKL